VEVWYPYARWERLLSLKRLVEAFPEVWLNAECLEDEHAHAHETLFRRIVTLVDGVVQNKNHKVMCSVSVNDERAKALVALQSLPEKHDHLGRPG